MALFACHSHVTPDECRVSVGVDMLTADLLTADMHLNHSWTAGLDAVSGDLHIPYWQVVVRLHHVQAVSFDFAVRGFSPFERLGSESRTWTAPGNLTPRAGIHPHLCHVLSELPRCFLPLRCSRGRWQKQANSLGSCSEISSAKFYSALPRSVNHQLHRRHPP